MASLHDRGMTSVRIAKAIALANGSASAAAAYAATQRGWGDVADILKTAVTALDTTSSLVSAPAAWDWAAYLRPMTVIGRLPLLKVPLRVRLLLQNAGASAAFIGQGKPVLVSKISMASDTLELRKVGALCVVTRELLESSLPAAEALLQRELGRASQAVLDSKFCDPSNAGTADVEPASPLNGVSPITSTGTNGAAISADLASLLRGLSDAGSDLSGAHFLMSTKAALFMSQLSGAGGAYFPKLGARGGEIWGVPVVTSAHCTRTGSPGAGDSVVAAIDCNEIALGDDGQSEFATTTVAALEQSDAPTNESTGSATATNQISLFQTHSAAILGIRFVNWQPRRSGMAQWYATSAY